MAKKIAIKKTAAAKKNLFKKANFVDENDNLITKDTKAAKATKDTKAVKSTKDTKAAKAAKAAKATKATKAIEEPEVISETEEIVKEPAKELDKPIPLQKCANCAKSCKIYSSIATATLEYCPDFVEIGVA